mgnify:CR=1 FL=1
MTIRVLLADDHAAFRQCVRSLLEAQPGVAVVGDLVDGSVAELGPALRLAHASTGDGGNTVTHFYYSPQWQIIETRNGAGALARLAIGESRSPAQADPELGFVKHRDRAAVPAK